MQYSYPVVRRLKWTLVGFVMADVIDVDYTLAGIGIPGDSLRVLRGGTSTVFNDEWKGQWNASALASVGLDIAGAAANNRFSAGPGFLKANFYLDRLQPLGSGFSAMLRGTAQLTTGTVPAAEVFSVGGRDWARAFFVSESFADRGAAVSAELRYAPDWLPIPSDKAEPYIYLFADHAWLSSADARNAPFFYEETSAGGGLRLRLFKKYMGEIEVAKALSSPPTNPPDLPWRVSFRIGTPF
jgi:hemolysin activation/secretion protein